MARRPLPVALMLLVASFLWSPPAVVGQQVGELQFVDQQITDILAAIAELAGLSIIPDETVSGRASYHFSNTDLNTALDVFLATYALYGRRDGSIIYVSRVSTDYDERAGTVSMDAEEVELPVLVRAAADAIGRTVLFDPLPTTRLTIHAREVTPLKLLQILTTQFPSFTVEEDADFYYIKRLPQQAPQAAAAGRTTAAAIRRDPATGRYSAVLERERFHQLIAELFAHAGLQYSSFIGRDSVIENFRVEDRSFDQLLRLLLDRGNADFARVGDIYYLFEVSEKDILKQLDTTTVIPLQHISVQKLTSLFPPDLVTSRMFKMDRASNAIILSGSLQELEPVEQFVRLVDRPQTARRYHRFDLAHVAAADIANLLPEPFEHVEPVPIPGTNSFVAPLADAGLAAFSAYIAAIDRADPAQPVRLRYIQAEQLVEKLPPAIAAEDVIETVDPTTVFVRGSDDQLRRFNRELALIDRPTPQIRYDLLVIQYQGSDDFNYDANTAASLTKSGAQTAFLGTIGNLLSLNFDIVSNFGYQFAVDLNLDLSSNRARVMADTTLNGLSGEEIKFQNTDTFRYRDREVDPDTGDLVPTGVVREITSGLIINLAGWVSGDGMITMNVDATVSKRGADVSAAGDPPPTSERVVSTQVRARSGEPIAIGGLIQQETTKTVQKIPLLGDIPLLGLAFRSQTESVTNTEMVIYVVPHVHRPEPDAAVASAFERLYRKFF